MKVIHFTSLQMMRQNAAKCLRLAEQAKDKRSRVQFLRMAEAWKSLAENQAWLDGQLTTPTSDVAA
jgi:hypothetical protein